ncbi:MAG: hypothetical protein KatS3mg038_1156 [Candidatus Kapaibacterium sp.]|nr:MAG: hypothetical protein KatS3mg038_1156 [Candidatus Kapabacteria bacterium]
MRDDSLSSSALSLTLTPSCNITFINCSPAVAASCPVAFAKTLTRSTNPLSASSFCASEGPNFESTCDIRSSWLLASPPNVSAISRALSPSALSASPVTPVMTLRFVSASLKRRYSSKPDLIAAPSPAIAAVAAPTGLISVPTFFAISPNTPLPTSRNPSWNLARRSAMPLPNCARTLSSNSSSLSFDAAPSSRNDLRTASTLRCASATSARILSSRSVDAITRNAHKVTSLVVATLLLSPRLTSAAILRRGQRANQAPVRA